MKKSFLPITLICTVLNEEKTLHDLLLAIANQKKLPAEVVLIDGSSSDNTLKIIQNAADTFPVKLIFAQKKGNRSIGRNLAITLSTQSIIASTDAGCIPNSNWLENLYEKYLETGAQVVAGYYQGVSKTPFEEAGIPYALVMPKNVSENNFLPATRSMLFEKKVWEKLGGFTESLSDNEDYAFARKMKLENIQIAFAKNAIVKWQPRSNISDFYNMIFRFARGDVQAKIIRPKVILIFARYILGMLLVLLIAQKSLLTASVFLMLVATFYSIWAVQKNKEFVPTGWYWLPVLQVVSDIAVQHGSLAGLIKLIK